MSKVGEILRKKREAEKISIAEAAAQTMISPKFIDGLEGGNPEVFPGYVYAKGFLRNYADYLGFDSEEISDLLEQFAGEWQTEETIAPQKAETPPERPKSNIYTYGGILLLGTIAAIAFWSFYSRKEEKKDSLIDPAKLIEETDISSVNEIESKKRQTTIPAETSKMLLERVTVEAFATERVGIQALIDDSKRGEVFLEPNQQVKWVGKKRISLTVDNAGGVVFKLNGRYIGALGKVGEAKKLLITSQGVEKVMVLETRSVEPAPKEPIDSKQPQPATGVQSVVGSSAAKSEDTLPPRGLLPSRESSSEQ